MEGWEAITKDDIAAKVIHTDMEEIGWFRCSNPMVNQLHENTRWSMRGNFVSIPTDCPQRDERLGWTGDIQVFCPTANFLYRTTGMLGGWLEDVAAEQLESGAPSLVVPNILDNIWPPTPQAVWGDVTVLTPWALYNSSGDVKILKAQYKSMITWVDKDIPRGKDGLWDPEMWQLGDWLDPKAPPENPGDGRTDGTMVADAYLVHVTRVLSQVSSILQDAANSSRFAEDTRRLKEAFQRKYVAPSGMISSDTQTGFALAIMFDLFEGEEQLAVAGDRLAALVKREKFRVATGFAGTPLITHALTRTGNLQLAYRMLLEKKCPSWLYPVSMGATTIWERWDSMLPDGSINPGSMTSFNHYALGSISNWLHEVVGGISSIEPGWKRFRVQPQPGGTLTSASVTHESPYGRIECQWSTEKLESTEHLELQIVVPPHSEACVVLPNGERHEHVGSGTYTFKCQSPVKDWPPRATHAWIDFDHDEGEVV